MALEAILFDMDGTLIDTETPDYEAWRAVYEAHGLALDKELWKQRIGKVVYEGADDVFDPAVHFERITGTRLDAATRQRQFDHYIQLCGELGVMPGVHDLLSEAARHGIKMAVASNSDRAWVEHWLRYYGLRHYFQCVLAYEDVENPKPAPDLYLGAARCLGVAVDRCVAIEDSPTGMIAVNAAGIRCIAVPNWLTVDLERPEVALTLNSLAELPFTALVAHFG